MQNVQIHAIYDNGVVTYMQYVTVLRLPLIHAIYDSIGGCSLHEICDNTWDTNMQYVTHQIKEWAIIIWPKTLFSSIPCRKFFLKILSYPATLGQVFEN